MTSGPIRDIPIQCNNCGKTILRSKYDLKRGSKYFGCSRYCLAILHGKLTDQPLGTKRHNNLGYIEIKIGPGKFGWGLEHRIIMEKKLGRKLKKGEIVHHTNNIRDDNIEDNLVVMNGIEHNRIHHSGENSGTAKLTDIEVCAILDMKFQGVSTSEVCEKFKISITQVNALARGVIRQDIYNKWRKRQSLD